MGSSRRRFQINNGEIIVFAGGDTYDIVKDRVGVRRNISTFLAHLFTSSLAVVSLIPWLPRYAFTE
jgi:hypothetical protein